MTSREANEGELISAAAYKGTLANKKIPLNLLPSLPGGRLNRVKVDWSRGLCLLLPD